MQQFLCQSKSYHLKCLQEIKQEKQISVNLSPKQAAQIKSLDCLMDNTTPQEVMAEPIEVVLHCYHCCLALGCKKKMKQEGPSRPPDNVY